MGAPDFVVSLFPDTAPVPPVAVLESPTAPLVPPPPPTTALLAVRSIGENSFAGLSPKDVLVAVDMGVDEGGGGERRTGEDDEFDAVDVGDMGSNDKEL